MYSIPSLPPWNAFHPLMVHFPISFLLIAPFFLMLGIFLPRARAKQIVLMAFVLVFVGTISLFFAVATGEKTADQITKTPEIQSVLHEHEELAETAEVVFVTLTLLFTMLLFGPKPLTRDFTIRGFRIALLLFLLVYAAGALILVNTASAGSRLVHEFGVTATNTAPAISRAGQLARPDAGNHRPSDR